MAERRLEGGGGDQPRPKVLLTRLLPQPVMEQARRLFHLLLDDPPEGLLDRSLLLERVGEAQGLIPLLTERVDRELLDAAPNLRVVANVAVGYDNIDVAAARSRGIEVTHTPGVLTETTAELTVALILAVTRRLVEADRFTRQGRFVSWGPTLLLGRDLRGSRVGLVGLGRIGQAVARRLAGFEAELVYADSRGLEPELEERLRVRRLSLERLLATSDVISLHLPLGPDTRHLISRQALGTMKREAVLINTSRGAVVDEQALAEALEQGRLAGAGLDVYEREPQINPRLLGREDVVLLPHIGSATTATRTRMGLLAVEDADAVLAGRPARHPVPG